MIKHINTEVEEKRFNKHLNIPHNDRILFSGIYGIGKSYFIKHFLKKYSSDFLPLYLNPVNYSVSSSEDIFEYIKYDICLQLAAHKPEYEKIDFGNEFYYNYFLNNYKEFFYLLIKNAAVIKGASAGLNCVSSIINDFEGFYKKLKQEKKGSNIDQEATLEQFILSSHEKIGSIYENNLLTELINLLINNIKSKVENKNKKLLLIIDDLDRIDPEHIFRILNIFSAHVDPYFKREKEGFKFEIDKIILIADIANIRNIFHARYGSSTDFAGYIDKFYSHEIFDYNFQEILQNELKEHVAKYFDKHIKLIERKIVFNNINESVTIIIMDLFKYNALNMRKFMSFLERDLPPMYKFINRTTTKELIHLHLSPIFVLFEFLLHLYGSNEETIYKLNIVEKNKPLIYRDEYALWYLMGDLVMVNDYNSNNLSPVDVMSYKIHEDLECTYKIENEFPNRYGLKGEILEYTKPSHNNISSTIEPKLPFYSSLISALKAYNTFKKETIYD